MKPITLDYAKAAGLVAPQEINQKIVNNRDVLQKVLHPKTATSDVLGWVDLDSCAAAGDDATD
jgi:hypothetical protein